MSVLGRAWLSSVKSVSLILIATYRMVGTLFLGGACRFEPSCSEYALEAFKRRPFTIAFKLVFFRILRCRPGGAYGFDPVPLGNEESHHHQCRGQCGTT